MKKIVRLTENDLVKLVKRIVKEQEVSEQNRKLLVRRFIKIKNSRGKTLLFDVTRVETNPEGCFFMGDFRGNYDSVLSFLGFDDVQSLLGFTDAGEGRAYNFNFDCSNSGKIVLDKTFKNESNETFTIDTEAQEVLSKVCKCSRYK